MKQNFDAYQFSDGQLVQVQQKSLEMALYFRDFCQAHGLAFFLCGGCLIGGLREGGFIPWDDDVDVFMPRPDYERLGALWEEFADTSRYSFQAPTQDQCTHNLFQTVNDNHTTYIKQLQADLDINHGIVLDILPLDGCPSGKLPRMAQKLWAYLYSIYCAQVVPQNHGQAVTLAGKLALGLVPSQKMRYRIWKFAEKRMSRWYFYDCEKITELCSGPGYMQNEYPAVCFHTAGEVSFEGHIFPAPADSDQYLTMAFGDYMTPPPPEKQVCHHGLVWCDTNRPYTDYRGIYYYKTEE
ncbi:MAG: LicD family protein [Oscillospiraceae bacterium]|nr:LicD family protein [Oscillospiraceae bacterium]